MMLFENMPLFKHKTLESARETHAQQLINHILKITNLNLYQLAKKLHINASELSIIYKGKVNHPSSKIYDKLLNFYCALTIQNDQPK